MLKDKKKHLENFIRSQKGSMDKFVVKETHEKKMMKLILVILVMLILVNLVLMKNSII